jgi:DNA-binding SARP family transcriptional activator
MLQDEQGSYKGAYEKLRDKLGFEPLEQIRKLDAARVKAQKEVLNASTEAKTFHATLLRVQKLLDDR